MIGNRMRVAAAVLFVGLACTTVCLAAGEGPPTSWEGWAGLGGGVTVMGAISWKLIDWMIRTQSQQLEHATKALDALTDEIRKGFSEVGEQTRANGRRMDSIQQVTLNCPTRLQEQLAKTAKAVQANQE